MSIRTAGPHEAAALASLINEAFIVEAFFKIGDRTSADEVAALMEAGGEFLVLEPNSEPGTGTGTFTGLRLFEVSRRPRVFRDAVHRP